MMRGEVSAKTQGGKVAQGLSQVKSKHIPLFALHEWFLWNTKDLRVLFFQVGNFVSLNVIILELPLEQKRGVFLH